MDWPTLPAATILWSFSYCYSQVCDVVSCTTVIFFVIYVVVDDNGVNVGTYVLVKTLPDSICN